MPITFLKLCPSPRKYLLSLHGSVLMILLLSCSAFYTKDNYIKDFTAFVKEVKENCTNFSNDDWVEIDKQYDNFTNEKYDKFKAALTIDEEVTILKLKSTYSALKIKKGAGQLFDQAKGLINDAREVIDSSMNTLNK